LITSVRCSTSSLRHGLGEPDMSEPHQSEPLAEQVDSTDVQRREALIKLGKYTAYATPILLATVTAAQAVSAPSPSPPSPVPE
jgi:hypothetical protein